MRVTLASLPTECPAPRAAAHGAQHHGGIADLILTSPPNLGDSMEDITKMPHTKLIKVKHESLADIRVCQDALDMGVTTYDKGKSVQERLEGNQDNVRKINAELARRLAEAAPAA